MNKGMAKNYEEGVGSGGITMQNSTPTLYCNHLLQSPELNEDSQSNPATVVENYNKEGQSNPTTSNDHTKDAQDNTVIQEIIDSLMNDFMDLVKPKIHGARHKLKPTYLNQPGGKNPQKMKPKNKP